jgi:hypothetical protein
MPIVNVTASRSEGILCAGLKTGFNPARSAKNGNGRVHCTYHSHLVCLPHSCRTQK